MSDVLKERGQIKVKSLQSNLPLVGRIRNGVASLASRWLVEDVVAQQNRFNSNVAGVSAELAQHIHALDQQVTSLTKQVAELETKLKQLEMKNEKPVLSESKDE